VRSPPSVEPNANIRENKNQRPCENSARHVNKTLLSPSLSLSLSLSLCVHSFSNLGFCVDTLANRVGSYSRLGSVFPSYYLRGTLPDRLRNRRFQPTLFYAVFLLHKISSCWKCHTLFLHLTPYVGETNPSYRLFNSCHFQNLPETRALVNPNRSAHILCGKCERCWPTDVENQCR